ncbi:hypothetical protein P7C73_g4640, partial [Tremellales sp. Uapishka_1]
MTSSASPRRLLQKYHPLKLLRPSVRLKTTLYLLSLTIGLLLLLAINAFSSPSALQPAGTDPLNTKPSHISPADSGEGKNVAQGKDGHLVDEEIQRSFEEPDFALLSGRQPNDIGCDVPLEGEGSGVLVFLGIFSTADKRERRDLYRRVILPDFPKHLVTVKFILGIPPFPESTLSQATIDRALLIRKVDEEMKEFGDIVVLPMIDNIDLGKTHEYFKWVAKTYGGEGRVKGRPRFVMKADDDTILVMPNMISAFQDLDCATNVYWGTSSGRSHYFGDYFRGLAYAMSWPLVRGFLDQLYIRSSARPRLPLVLCPALTTVHHLPSVSCSHVASRIPRSPPPPGLVDRLGRDAARTYHQDRRCAYGPMAAAFGPRDEPDQSDRYGLDDGRLEPARRGDRDDSAAWVSALPPSSHPPLLL